MKANKHTQTKKKRGDHSKKQEIIRQIRRTTKLYDDIDLSGAGYGELLRIKALHESYTMFRIVHPGGPFDDV